MKKVISDNPALIDGRWSHAFRLKYCFSSWKKQSSSDKKAAIVVYMQLILTRGLLALTSYKPPRPAFCSSRRGNFVTSVGDVFFPGFWTLVQENTFRENRRLKNLQEFLSDRNRLVQYRTLANSPFNLLYSSFEAFSELNSAFLPHRMSVLSLFTKPETRWTSRYQLWVRPIGKKRAWTCVVPRSITF